MAKTRAFEEIEEVAAPAAKTVVTLPNAPAKSASEGRLSENVLGTFGKLTEQCFDVEFDEKNLANTKTAILLIAIEPDGSEQNYWMSKPLSEQWYEGEIGPEDLINLPVRTMPREGQDDLRIICAKGSERIRISLADARKAAKPYKSKSKLTQAQINELCNISY